MMALKELCTRLTALCVQNISRSCEQSWHILRPSSVTVWSIAQRSTTPLALRKQSRTPYLIFASDKMNDIKKSNPGIRIPELGRMLGQMWRSLSVENKEVYKKRYQDEKEVFIAKKNAELDKMTEAEKTQLYQQKEEKKNKRKTRKERKLLKDLMKPRPTDVNPFVLFFKSKAAERGDAPVSVHLKRQSDVWKTMSDEQRKPFVDQAHVNSVRYQDELKRWEKKMFTQGNTNVLSPDVVKKLQSQQITGRKPRTRNTASTQKSTTTSRKPKTTPKAK